LPAQQQAISTQIASPDVILSFNSERYNLKIPAESQSQKLEVFIIRTSQMFM
jgi:hypothetical protein